MAARRISCVTAAIVAALAFTGAACLGAEYGDIPFERKAKGGVEDVPPAVFPHWIHRMQYKCGACHDEAFQMKAGTTEITMDLIQSGKACGLCHNGKAAFEPKFETCPRCHVR
jgi:c(7)-type cytochrome triheme protein